MPEEKVFPNAKKTGLFKNCRQYNIPLWQCPSFLFLVMGLFIIAVIIATYYVATAKIDDPQIVSLIVLAITAVLFIISHIITNSFERVSEANRMKSEFINIVSHQLRGPLTNLRYALEVLSSEMGERDKKEKEYFLILEENFQRMGTLINNLLLVSRLEMGKLPLAKVDFSMEETAKKVILKSKAHAEARGVKIFLRSEKGLPNAFADVFWVEQIVQNLIDNAIRYTGNGGEIEIKIKKTDNKNSFEIKDSGLGIPKEEQKYIFQKFFRSKNVLTFQPNGTGLGLYIVKEILDTMDGKISFKSKEGEGTTFFFSLPLSQLKSKV